MSAKKLTKFVGEDAGKQALNKSKWGKTSWVVYRDRQGQLTAELMTAASVKNALLSKGTKGRFKILIEGKSLMLGWKTGLNQLYHLSHPDPVLLRLNF